MSGTSSKLDIPPADPTTIVDLDLQEILRSESNKTAPPSADETVESGPPAPPSSKSSAGSQKSKPRKRRKQPRATTNDAGIDLTSVSNEQIEAQLERKKSRQKRWLGQPIPYRPKHMPQIEVAEVPKRERLSLQSLLRASPTWLTSAVLHVVLIVVLSWFTLSHIPDENRVVLIGDAEPKRIEPIQLDVQIRVPTIVQQVSSTEQVAGEIKQDKRRSGSMPAVLPQFLSSSKRRAGPVGAVRALFGREGLGGTETGSGKGGAEFFGVKATGNKFVFVVDSSRSMIGPKWVDACNELLAAVERLKPNQKFYVIFFDAFAHPLPNPANIFQPNQPILMQAGKDNVALLKQFISGIQLGFETKPFMAVRMAMQLEPDAIYLLSDGEFRDGTAKFLKRNNKIKLKDRLKMPAVVVHTIGFHSRRGQRVLRRIAKDNGGTYKYVKGRRR